MDAGADFPGAANLSQPQPELDVAICDFFFLAIVLISILLAFSGFIYLLSLCLLYFFLFSRLFSHYTPQ